MRKIGCTGGQGRVGKLLAPYGAVDLGCDVTNPLEIRRAIKYHKPDIIVHLAGISDVDFCEDPQNEKQVINVNFWGTNNVAEASSEYGCPMVMLSSDHVFDGNKWWGKYKETDKQNPINFYGLSKTSAEGIQATVPSMKIVRTSYLFDYGRLKDEIIRLSSREHITYPSFIKRSFMYAPHFVQSFLEYLHRFDEMPDILHISGCKVVSWHGFMSVVANKLGFDMTKIIPRTKEAIGTHAPRGYRLGLDVSLSRKLGLPQFDYIDGIEQMLRDSG